ncbi:hypothetical protein BH23PLA1_BH23PLA1_11280 [soil metagenome]
MRPWRSTLLVGLVAAVSLIGVGSDAFGQRLSTAGMGTSNGLPPGLRTNPFANPTFNPFLNPYARSGPMGQDELMLYFLAARQSAQAQAQTQGNSGADRRASARPQTLPQTTFPSQVSPAEMPYRLMTPGGSAGSYYNRQSSSGPGGSLYGQHFGRYGRHFKHNGR